MQLPRRKQKIISPLPGKADDKENFAIRSDAEVNQYLGQSDWTDWKAGDFYQ